ISKGARTLAGEWTRSRRLRPQQSADEAKGEETRVVAAAGRRRGVRRKEPAAPARRARAPGAHGGGGNRTRVRCRPEQNVYKRSPPLNLARRPEADALPAGQPSFSCRTSGDWLSFGAEPVLGAATRATGPARSDVAT